MLTEDFSQTCGSQYCSACPSTELTWPATDDNHEALHLPSLPEIDFGDLLGPFTNPPELQTDLPAFGNVGSITLDQTSLPENLLPNSHFNAQTAIDETQREVWELRYRVYDLEQRMKLYECLLAQLQQE